MIKTKQETIKLHGAYHNMKELELVEKQKEISNKISQEKYECYNLEQLNEFIKESSIDFEISSFKKKVEEFLKTKKLNYECKYTIIKDNTLYIYDFAIFDNQNNLSVLILTEHSNSHYYSHNLDSNNEINNYNGIPENVKFVKIIENDFNKGIQELTKYCKKLSNRV